MKIVKPFKSGLKRKVIFYSSQLYYTELLAFTYFNCYNDSMDDEKGRVIAAFLRYFNDDPERAVAAVRQYTARDATAQTKNYCTARQ